MRKSSVEARPGDILHGVNNRNKDRRIRPHYMVYLGSAEQPGLFLGAMLTHSPRFGNLQMQENHFEKTDSTGNPW